jgi:hypothetical protein
MILGQTFSLLANNCISRLQTFMCMNWVTSLVIHFVGLKRTMLFYSIQRNRLVNKQKKKKKKKGPNMTQLSFSFVLFGKQYGSCTFVTFYGIYLYQSR